MDKHLQVVERIPEVVRERYGDPLGIFIFGSVSRGEHSPDSDIDLIVFCQDLDGSIQDKFSIDGIEVDASILTREDAFKKVMSPHKGDFIKKIATGRFLHQPEPGLALLQTLAKRSFEKGPDVLQIYEAIDVRASLGHFAQQCARAKGNSDVLAALMAMAYGALVWEYPRVLQRWQVKRTAFLKDVAQSVPKLHSELLSYHQSTSMDVRAMHLCNAIECLLESVGGFLPDQWEYP